MSFALSVFNIPWLESYAVPDFCFVSKQGIIKSRGGGEFTDSESTDLDSETTDLDSESTDLDSDSDSESTDLDSETNLIHGNQVDQELLDNMLDVFVNSDYFDETNLIPEEKEEEKEEDEEKEEKEEKEEEEKEDDDIQLEFDEWEE